MTSPYIIRQLLERIKHDPKSKDIDELSLSSGKSININLIKKVINQ